LSIFIFKYHSGIFLDSDIFWLERVRLHDNCFGFNNLFLIRIGCLI
jgi:hypothetical protein